MSSAVVRTPYYKALIWAIGLTLFTLVAFPRQFQENDDLGFIYLLSHGLYAPWVSKPFCALLIQLYQSFPGIAWYGLAHYLILALDLALLLKLVGDWAADRGLSDKIRCWLWVAAFLLFYPFIIKITFTSTSIFSGALGLLAALTYVQRRPQTDQWPQTLGSLLGFGLLFACCYLVRPEALGAMAFLLPAILICCYNAWKSLGCRKLIVSGLAFGLPLLALVSLDKAVMRYPAAQTPYLSFVVESNDIFGFGYSDEIKHHPEWLAEIGWNYTDFGMLERFLYWDETVFSKSNMDCLTAHVPAAIGTRLQLLAIPSVFFSRVFKTLAKTWLSNFPFTLYCLGLFILFALMGRSRFDRLWPGVILVVLFLGSVVMQYVLRFPFRVACPIILVGTLSLLALSGFDPALLRQGNGRLSRPAQAVLAFCVLGLLVFNGPYRLVKSWLQPLAQKRHQLEVLGQLQASHYIMREAGVIQITAFDPLDPASLRAPDIGPGWLVQSLPFYQRLQAFGVANGAALIPASFNNPKVLYFFKDKNLPVLQAYLAQHYRHSGRFVETTGLLPPGWSSKTHLYQLQMP